MDPNATHLERLVANTSYRKALQEDLSQHRKRKILEAAQERSLKKCRRDLNDSSTPLSALKREDRTVTTSRYEMESITERFYTRGVRNFPCSEFRFPAIFGPSVPCSALFLGGTRKRKKKSKSSTVQVNKVESKIIVLTSMRSIRILVE
ncbi:unnamed protein product [Nippostrongylus brasiliensis]|uniref:Uncharacterized protein n=1 Tax=Nippostrongylus brasiliensis TaxID=27835 RepID=A0A0N4YN05_NIPBR|nr:unnamed protein product [Nippostrongylus brasiliensis]